MVLLRKGLKGRLLRRGAYGHRILQKVTEIKTRAAVLNAFMKLEKPKTKKKRLEPA